MIGIIGGSGFIGTRLVDRMLVAKEMRKSNYEKQHPARANTRQQ